MYSIDAGPSKSLTNTQGHWQVGKTTDAAEKYSQGVNVSCCSGPELRYRVALQIPHFIWS